jgi:hypothetical protein
MTDVLSALTSPILPIRPVTEYDGAPESSTLAFNEIWQDKEKGLTFGDFLDIINPLQHIPVVSTIYRMVTGDEIGMGARLAGGALYGGPLGVVAAGAVAGFEEASGSTVEQHIASLFGLDNQSADAAAPPQIAVAAHPALPPGTPPGSLPVLTADQAAALVAARVAPAAGQTVPSASARQGDALPVGERSFPARPQKTFPSQAPQQVPQQVPQSEKMPGESASAQQPAESSSARLARQIAEAQRAQAGLLIANLQATGAVSALTSSGDDAKTETGEGSEKLNRAESLPFRSHPYMLPPGAPSSLVASTMERALQRYHQGLQRQNAPVPTMAPAAAPAR